MILIVIQTTKVIMKDILFTALKPALENSYSITMNEGAVKATLVDHLLRTGHTLIEGGAAGPRVITLIDGIPTLASTYVMRRPISADLRIILPEPCTIEIQCRSILSSQNAISSKNILDDVWRVESNHADLFL